MLMIFVLPVEVHFKEGGSPKNADQGGCGGLIAISHSPLQSVSAKSVLRLQADAAATTRTVLYGNQELFTRFINDFRHSEIIYSIYTKLVCWGGLGILH